MQDGHLQVGFAALHALDHFGNRRLSPQHPQSIGRVKAHLPVGVAQASGDAIDDGRSHFHVGLDDGVIAGDRAAEGVQPRVEPLCLPGQEKADVLLGIEVDQGDNGLLAHRRDVTFESGQQHGDGAPVPEQTQGLDDFPANLGILVRHRLQQQGGGLPTESLAQFPGRLPAIAGLFALQLVPQLFNGIPHGLENRRCPARAQEEQPTRQTD